MTHGPFLWPALWVAFNAAAAGVAFALGEDALAWPSVGVAAFWSCVLVWRGLKAAACFGILAAFYRQISSEDDVDDQTTRCARPR